MTTAAITYGTSTADTFTLASLATDTNLLVGRASAAIDNTSTLAIDYSAYFKITTGTSPTASKQIEIWCGPSEDGTNYAGGIGGSDAGKTLTAEAKANLILIKIMPTNNTSNVAYEWVCASLANVIGGLVTRKFGFWVVHNTGVNLNATGGNQVVSLTATKFTSA